MLDDAGGRTSRAEQYRRPRRSLFSPPNERDEACFGVTEHPLDTRLWAEPGKRVRVRQTAALASLWHPDIMPTFQAFSTHMKSGETKPQHVLSSMNSPIRNHQDPLLLIVSILAPM